MNVNIFINCNKDQEALKQLDEIRQNLEKILLNDPEGIEGTISFEKANSHGIHEVYIDQR